MQGSPFLLTVLPRRRRIIAEDKQGSLSDCQEEENEPQALSQGDDEMKKGVEEDADTKPEGARDGGVKEEEEKMDKLIVQISGQEATMRRAELALQKQRAKLASEREERRRNKAVRRCGGGFHIQYSKEI